MQQVKLEEAEWQQLIAILREVAMPWRLTNPLIVKITNQVDPEMFARTGNGEPAPLSEKRFNG